MSTGTGPAVEAEDPRLSRIEEEVARLRHEREADIAAKKARENYATSWSGKQPTGWQQEQTRRDNERTLAKQRQAREAEAARQARAEANAPKIAKLVPDRDRLEAELETARARAREAEGTARRIHSELVTLRSRIAALEYGAEGAE